MTQMRQISDRLLVRGLLADPIQNPLPAIRGEPAPFGKLFSDFHERPVCFLLDLFELDFSVRPTKI